MDKPVTAKGRIEYSVRGNLLRKFDIDIKNIYSSLLKYSYSEQEKDFYTGDNKQRGLLSTIHGAISLLELILFSQIDGTERDKDRIINALNYILNYTDQYGYDLTPYIPRAQHVDIFGEKASQTETLAATVVLLSLIRRAHFNDKKIILPDALTERVAKTLREIFEIFCAGVKKEKGNYGWSTLIDGDSAVLSSTYKVIEAYSRFEDSVLNKKDEGFIKLIGKDIVDKFVVIVQETGMAIYQSYKQAYGERLFNNDAERTNVTVEQIALSNRSTALFYPIYIAMITMMAYTDKALAREDIAALRYAKSVADLAADEAEEVERELDERIENNAVDGLDRYNLYLNKTRDAIENVQIYYRKLISSNQSDIVDCDYFSYNSKQLTAKNIVKLRKLDLVCGYLKPLILNAKSMIVSALIKYPQQEMNGLYDEIMKTVYDAGKKIYLWNEEEISLFATERNVSAILYQYLSYYERFELYFKASQLKDNEFENLIRDLSSRQIKEKEELFNIEKRGLEEEKQIAVRELEAKILGEREKAAKEIEAFKTALTAKTALAVEVERLATLSAKSFFYDNIDNVLLLNLKSDMYMRPEKLAELESANKHNEAFLSILEGVKRALKKIYAKVETLSDAGKKEYMEALIKETERFKQAYNATTLSSLIKFINMYYLGSTPEIYEKMLADGKVFARDWATIVHDNLADDASFRLKTLLDGERYTPEQEKK